MVVLVQTYLFPGESSEGLGGDREALAGEVWLETAMYLANVVRRKLAEVTYCRLA